MLRKLTLIVAFFPMVASSMTRQAYAEYAQAVEQAYQQLSSERLVKPLVEYLTTLEQACDELLHNQAQLRTFLQSTARRRHGLSDSIRDYATTPSHEQLQRLERSLNRYAEELKFAFDAHFAADEFPAIRQVVATTMGALGQVGTVAHALGARLHETIIHDTLQLHAKVAHALEGALEISEDDWYDAVSALKDYVVHSQVEFLQGAKSFEEVTADAEIAAFCIISLVNNFTHHYQGHITDDGMGLVRKIALLLNTR